MMLLAWSLVIISTCLGIRLAYRSNVWAFVFLVLLLATYPIARFAGYDIPPEYRYEASIKMSLNSDFSPIYFSDFSQDGDTIVIDKYAKKAYHWLDFNKYDIVDSTLTIKLLDNNNQFIYKDRFTGDEFGKEYSMINTATQ